VDLILLDNPLVIWGIGLALTALITLPFVLGERRAARHAADGRIEAANYGLEEPASLHPVVDPARCIGIGTCVKICPEDVLGLELGQGVAIKPARCIGHGLCERVCPMEAIQLVFGTEKRGVELPRIQENFETNVRGLYIVGELGGMGLVANAFEQGRQCIDDMMQETEKGPEGIQDLLIVGCGPAGLSASLNAKHRGLDFVTLDKEDIGGTVRHYPRKKLVMTRPVKVPGYGKLPIRDIVKEELIEIWEDVVNRLGLEVQTGVTVESVRKVAPFHFKVETSAGTFEAARVILAIGRRGVPRKLDVPGEESPHVQYSLREPESFQGEQILVVGGGDSAIEAAVALSEQPGNRVTISYRRDAFSRIKPDNQQRVTEAIDEGRINVLWSSNVREIQTSSVTLTYNDETIEHPATQVFIFAGGVLPTPFLRDAGIEIETKFGQP
jgi:thioredoxin reductase/NAD-dependent dihydropyrimidine dehydrogenase PreA subunit